MGQPSLPTVKRLFAVSGNRCAFPKCQSKLIDEETEKVIGKICHIKGNKPRSARYDAEQSEEDRQSFENLILMCGIHHDVIDADSEAYTFDRLIKLKTEHEAGTATEAVSEDRVVQQFINNVAGISIEHGSVIINQGQIGGQVAHSITNIGPQPRILSDDAIRYISGQLLKHPPHDYEIESNSDDSDGGQLAYQMTIGLNTANWNCLANAKSMFPRPMIGLTVSYPKKTSGVSALLEGLRKAGLTPEEKELPALEKVHILVGYRRSEA